MGAREKKIIVAAFEAIIYNTWITRNMMILKKKRHEETYVIQQVKNTIKERAKITQDKKKRSRCIQLFQRICDEKSR